MVPFKVVLVGCIDFYLLGEDSFVEKVLQLHVEVLFEFLHRFRLCTLAHDLDIRLFFVFEGRDHRYSLRRKLGIHVPVRFDGGNKE